MCQRGVLILSLFVLIVLLMIGGSFYVTQKRSKIASVGSTSETVELSAEKGVNSISKDEWKVYQNEEYGFEFRYPARKFVLDASGPTAQADLLVYICDYSACSFGSPLITIMTDRDFFANLDMPQLIERIHGGSGVQLNAETDSRKITAISFDASTYWFLVAQGQRKIIVQSNGNGSNNIDLGRTIAASVQLSE